MFAAMNQTRSLAIGVALIALVCGPFAGDARAQEGAKGLKPGITEPRAGESREFDGMEFVWVPAGEFRMGSTLVAAPDNTRPVTRVRISRGFYMGKFEVTRDQWQAVMGSNPVEDERPKPREPCGDCPVESVSWFDVQAFIRELNGRNGVERYRLPTEAEWEYAARAGTSRDRYAANLDAIAWFDKNSGGGTP